jgi:uncharacterized protein YecE (DUF72 family)
MAKTFLGTCGWSYNDWIGPVYPTKSTPKIKYYSSIFSTVEIDSTFYASPKPEVVQGWIRNTPAGFKFSLKLPQLITHKKRLENIEDDTAQFLDLIKPLSNAGKLGAVLVQLPPSFTKKSTKTLENFFQLLPSSFSYAVEFRDRSWEEKDTFTLLEHYKISSVITDSPLELATELTTDWTFVRYHGRGQKIWYDYKYSEQEISMLAKKLQEMQEKTSLVYGYFNNHYGGNAVENVLQLIQLTGNLASNQLELLNRFKMKKDLDSFV